MDVEQLMHKLRTLLGDLGVESRTVATSPYLALATDSLVSVLNLIRAAELTVDTGAARSTVDAMLREHMLARLVEGAVESILETHRELGLMPDEGPHHDGGYGPYTQSERLSEYAPRLQAMCEKGSAYYCFCSSERLDALRAEQTELKLPPGYDGHCRHIPLEEAKERIANGEKYTIRLKVPKAETIIFNDLIRGRIEFQSKQIDDAVLLKSDGIFPTYHGAVVIDDYLMGITHVMRGEEWISSIPIQVLTARALGITLLRICSSSECSMS